MEEEAKSEWQEIARNKSDTKKSIIFPRLLAPIRREASKSTQNQVNDEAIENYGSTPELLNDPSSSKGKHKKNKFNLFKYTRSESHEEYKRKQTKPEISRKFSSNDKIQEHEIDTDKLPLNPEILLSPKLEIEEINAENIQRYEPSSCFFKQPQLGSRFLTESNSNKSKHENEIDEEKKLEGSSEISEQPNSNEEKRENTEDVGENLWSNMRNGVNVEGIGKKLNMFKQFDIVSDYSDHYFFVSEKSKSTASRISITKMVHNFFFPEVKLVSSSTSSSSLPVKWTKHIHQEWKTLEKNLPEEIYVRIYEERMDLMRAVVTGSEGTPYHHGLFFFDIAFPPNYPSSPPILYYHSGGMRLNPNLYCDGKVCLSILNTWNGSKSEMWTPGKSTILQVLVSIRALVLNEKPYFNEPGFQRFSGTHKGERASMFYNRNAFIFSLKTMLRTLLHPPKNFEDLVIGHFFNRGSSILSACKAHMDSGSVFGLADENKDEDKGLEKNTENFKSGLSLLLPKLVQAFSKIGLNCDQFLDKTYCSGEPEEQV